METQTAGTETGAVEEMSLQSTVPCVLIVPLKDGRKRLRVESEHPAETCLQLRHARAAARQSMELIDAAGNCFRPVKGTVVGIDWGLYWRGGLLGPIVLLLDLVFFPVVMVRFRLECDAAPTTASLLEVKRKVREAVLANPGAYTYASPKEIAGRINVAPDLKSLMRSIGRD